MSIKRNILRNGVATLLARLVRVSEQLLLVPFFITSWGAAYYGEWLTLTIIPSVLAYSDLGFGSAAANSFTLRYVSGDHQGAADIEKTGFRIISYCVLLGIVVTTVFLLLAIRLNWLEKSQIPANDIITAVILMMISKLIGFYNQLFYAHFAAARRAALSINLLTISSALSLITGAVVLLLNGGIVQFALWQCVVAVSFTAFYWWRAIAILGLHKECNGNYTPSYAKDIVSKGLGYLASPMWQSILFQGTTFVVRLTLGPVAVAIFNTVRTLSRSVNQMYSMINVSIFPELQYEIGAGNTAKAQKIFLYGIRSSLLLALGGVAFLAIWGLPLYNWWTQKALTPPLVMWYIFLGGILLNAVWWTAGTVFRATNKPYPLAISGTTVAILSVLVSYICCKLWGLNGAALGGSFFEATMMLYILPTSCKLIKLKMSRIFDFNLNQFYKTIHFLKLK